MSPEEHAAAVADPARRGSEIEVPIACAACDGRRLRKLLHVYDHRRKTPHWDYHVVRCADCGFLYRHPGIRPERLGDLYASGNYAKFLAGKYTRKRIRRYKVTMAPFGALFKSGDGRRLLDFGCGNGLFLDIAYKRGFECYGVDLAADAIEAAREKPSGRHAYHGQPDEIPEIAAGGFQVITMWSVLAHLAQPVEDLTMLRRLLAPDGVLLILTVNADSLALKRRVETWGGFTPNHLLFSSPRTLPLLLRRAGFGAVVMPPWYGEPVERGTHTPQRGITTTAPARGRARQPRQHDPSRRLRRSRRPAPVGARGARAADHGMTGAGATGLEPATSGVTGRRSNQLSYAPSEHRE